MSNQLTSKRCPYCNEQDCLVVDYQAGHVACSSCAYIVEGGLLEDPRTAWEEDGVGVDEGWGRRDLAKLDGGGRGKQDKLWSTLDALQSRTGVTENVAEAAKSYAEAYTAKVRATNATAAAPQLLAATCFNIASVIRHLPVMPHELEASPVLRDVTAGKIVELRGKVLGAIPTLNAEYAEVSSKPHADLVQFYGRRMRPTLTPAQCKVAAAIAARYSDVVDSKRDVATVASLAMYFTLTNAAAAAQVSSLSGSTTLPLPSTGRTMVNIAAAGKHNAEVLGKLVKDLKADVVDRLVRAANADLGSEPKGVADAGLPLPDARKRERGPSDLEAGAAA